MTVTLAKFTVEDYHHLIETGVLDGRPVELLQGLIVEMAPEGPIHANRICNVANFFRAALGLGAVREAHPITLPDSEPEPDVAIVTAQQYEERHPGPPDIFLIIEVAYSSLGKDLNEKVTAYASAGILEYWLVDLLNERVIVKRHPQDNSYELQQEFTAGTITPLQFPNINVPVALLLGDVC